MNDRILFDYYKDDEIDEAVIALQRRPRNFYERVNYLELYDNHDFICRFRISKETFRTFLRLIQAAISPPSQRNRAILAPFKLYMMLRYLATGSFLLTVADLTEPIARHRSKFIYFPNKVVDMRKVISGFYSVSSFPRVVGAVDCTHIKIQSTGKQITYKIIKYVCCHKFYCH
ncbi:Uncharacterized protein FWK35_00036912 [Aphis craccivora]|uniref:Nuclease HARBI1 n=1 Tax=Aphis craccivora TaxID=307492 RepID=A0A6G0VLL0_APHCR|nr:Uncharacterized protein FWK35_00036912 [Aphis craccivora]